MHSSRLKYNAPKCVWHGEGAATKAFRKQRHGIARAAIAAGIAVAACCLALCLPPAFGGTLQQGAAFAESADSPQSADQQSETQTVRVGYYESRDFQEGAAEGERKSGYGYEYLQRVASYAGWRYEYAYGSWDDLYQKLCDGEIDMLAGVSQTEQHADQVKFPFSSMLSETFYIYSSASDSALDSATPETFSGARIGVVGASNASAAFDEWLDETGCGAQKVEFSSFSDVHAAFAAGGIDAFVASDNVVHGIDDVAPEQIVGKMPYYLAVSSSRSDILMQLNEVLGIMNSQDRAFLDDLQSRYAADTAVNVYVTSDERRWIAEHPTLVVGYMNNYLPYCDTDSGGNATGLFVDVLHEMLDKLPGGWEPEIQTRAYDDQADLIEALKNGDVDLAFPVGGGSWYAEENGFLLSSPVLSPTMNLVLRENYDLGSGEPQTVAVNSRNLLQRLYAERALPDATIVEYSSIDECLNAVVAGKVDGTILNGLRASALLASEPQLISVQLATPDDRCFGVGEGNGALLQLVNRGLGLIGEGYGVDASYDYTSGLFKYTFADFLRDNWAVFALLAALVVAIALAFTVRHFRKLRLENEREVEQNRRLEEALGQAERANRAKDELLTNLSHDIRTPLNGILGVIDINNGQGVDEDAARENMEKARAASRQLLRLVDDLLEMSKLRSGDAQVSAENFALSDVLDSVLAEVAPQAAEAGVNVVYSGHGARLAGARVSSSPVYVRQILANVLDNAVRYNKPGGRVVVEADLALGSGMTATFSCTVSDTGVGMDDTELKALFEPFSQGERGARSVYSGSGLGMAVVKSLVDLMGGSISAESEPGNGTKVFIELPFALASGNASGLAAAADAACAAADGAASNGAPSIAGMRVLVAEDNELNLEIVRCVLERAGAHVVAVARDGKQAVELFAASPEKSIDAIVMDVMMPVMDGYAATRAIRALDREDARTVIVVALTAKAFAADRAEALAAGMDEHLPKPLDAPRLVSVLSKLRR